MAEIENGKLPAEGMEPASSERSASGGVPEEVKMPWEPEHASRALYEVQALLREHASFLEMQTVEFGEGEESALGEHVGRASIGLEEPTALVDLRLLIEGLHPADLAYVLEGLPFRDRLRVWELIASDRAGEILLEMSESAREFLIRSMDRSRILEALEPLDADEIAELAPELPSDVVEKVRQGLSKEAREQFRASMSFPDDSVGAVMDFEAITVRQDDTLDTVLKELRFRKELPDHTDQVFVVDEKGVLVGGLALYRILIRGPQVRVKEVMRTDLLRLHPLESAREAAQAFERYDLVSAPVVDACNRVIGRVKVAEVLDVIRQEGEAEVLAIAGLREEEDLFSGTWASARNRWLWLIVNLCTAFFSTRAISAFEGVINQVVALAALMPVVAGIAGNSGNQTMTLIIRSIALGQVNASNARGLFVKEFFVALLNGVVFGGGAGLITAMIYHSSANGPLLGLTMALAIFLNLLVGALVGLAVPLVLRRMGRDPAMGSSVLLTFSTDSMGFLIFLGLAALFFR